MNSEAKASLHVQKADDHWVIRFSAMASPCEILVRCKSSGEVTVLADIAISETIRIEQKFSRYLKDNIVHSINTSGGKAVAIDDETANLLKYAGHCYHLSEGNFDITSGVLRKAWQFRGEEFSPDRETLHSLLELVGWEKVTLTTSSLQLRPGMEIDFGGIGKEYAVDRVANMLFERFSLPLMVNFGGDIRAIAPAEETDRWRVGIEDPHTPGCTVGMVGLSNGALATSGDVYRFCLLNGRRLGHILNPRTGWPVEEAPRSVTVLADYCTEAGLLCTMAMLKGSNAESFLCQQGVKYYCHH
jgi:FAD:protein FMN transferase